MPKEYTHWCLIKNSVTAIPPKARSVIKKHLPFFYIGAVLPDCYMYSFSTQGTALSRKFHEAFHSPAFSRKARLNMKRFVEARTSFPPSVRGAELSLAAGILGHVTADHVFHPMVDAVSGKGIHSERKRQYMHIGLETQIDLLYTGRADHAPFRLLGEYLRWAGRKRSHVYPVLYRVMGYMPHFSAGTFHTLFNSHVFFQGLLGFKLPLYILKGINLLSFNKLRGLLPAFYNYRSKLRFPDLDTHFEFMDYSGKECAYSILELEKIFVHKFSAILDIFFNALEKPRQAGRTAERIMEVLESPFDYPRKDEQPGPK